MTQRPHWVGIPWTLPHVNVFALNFCSNAGISLNSIGEHYKLSICLVFHCSKESSIIALVCSRMYVIKPLKKNAPCLESGVCSVGTWHYKLILWCLSETWRKIGSLEFNSLWYFFKQVSKAMGCPSAFLSICSNYFLALKILLKSSGPSFQPIHPSTSLCTVSNTNS